MASKNLDLELELELEGGGKFDATEQSSRKRGSERLKMLFLATFMIGNIPQLKNNLKNFANEKCLNPACQNTAEPDRTHCSVSCYKSHYHLK